MVCMFCWISVFYILMQIEEEEEALNNHVCIFSHSHWDYQHEEKGKDKV